MAITSFFGGAFFGGEFFNTPAPVVVSGGKGGLITFLAWRAPDKAEVERIRLEKLLAKKKKQLEKIAKKIEVVEKKIESPERPQGILVNLHLLEVRRNVVRSEIETILVNLKEVVEFMGGLDFKKYFDDLDDDDDEEIMWMQ